MTIKLEQVLDAIESADDAFTYFFDKQTGETVFLSDPHDYRRIIRGA